MFARPLWVGASIAKHIIGCHTECVGTQTAAATGSLPIIFGLPEKTNTHPPQNKQCFAAVSNSDFLTVVLCLNSENFSSELDRVTGFIIAICLIASGGVYIYICLFIYMYIYGRVYMNIWWHIYTYRGGVLYKQKFLQYACVYVVYMGLVSIVLIVFNMLWCCRGYWHDPRFLSPIWRIVVCR